MYSIRVKTEAIAQSYGKKAIHGLGNENADILLLGEAPGANEEATGIPFCGSAGKNLDEFLQILDIKRGDVYITNTVKFRPVSISKKTGKEINRPPKNKEIEAFFYVLREEIDIISPKIIVTLGNVALKGLMGNEYNIGKCHGKVICWGRYKIFPLYHPAAIIYKRSLKEDYIKDLEMLKKYIDEFI